MLSNLVSCNGNFNDKISVLYRFNYDNKLVNLKSN